MTTTLSVANGLSAIMVPIGIVGAALAVICAIVAGIAIMRGAAGLCGGAVGLWIPCAIVSASASFGSQWMPLQVSAAALIGMLVIGAVVRAIVNTAQAPTTGSAATPVAAPKAARAATRTVAPVTGTLAVQKSAHAA